MNCETEFRAASFAGIEFEIMPSDHSGGRRILTQKYPFKDDHYNEDLGDEPLKWSVTGKFVGEGWRDRLTEAKQRWTKSGAGKFFEPTENKTFEAVLVTWSFSYDSASLNSVEFTLELVEKGLEPYLNLDGSPAFSASSAQAQFIRKMRNWYLPRFDLYQYVSDAFRGYDEVRGYFNILSRQFIGLGSFLGVSGALSEMEPSRDANANIDRVQNVFETAATSFAEGGSDPIEFYKAASEVRLTGNQEIEDQAIMSAGIALAYHFESVANDATIDRMAEFRARAESLQNDANDPEIHAMVNGLISSLGGAANPQCVATFRGSWPALVAAYEVDGDISRAFEIMALSGGVSGSLLNEVVYPCQI